VRAVFNGPDRTGKGPGRAEDAQGPRTGG
jgi:hypothetical protein